MIAVQERAFGAVGGLAVAGAAVLLQLLPWGWVLTGLLLALTGAVLGGYIRHLRRVADRDELTGMMNRRSFERTLHGEFERAIRYGRPLSLLFIEVDDFGQVNKQHGHLAGDATLKAVVREMRGMIRSIDFLARWGGDEFVLILPETDRHHAYLLADRIRATVETCLVKDMHTTISVTVSAGVASIPGSSRKPADLLRLAIEGQRVAKVHKNAVEIVS